MNAESHKSLSSASDLQAAFAECQERWAHSLVIDPLELPQVYDAPCTVHAQKAPPVEVELLTRPKTGGGTRLEVVPDCATSFRLQAVARRLRDRIFPSPHSVLSVQSPGSQQYALWSDTVPLWIRHMLVDGRTVVVADIEDYFCSVPERLIEDALKRAGLDDASIDGVGDTIQKINSIPDRAGATRRGLPVSRDDLFWYVADLVLRPVDELLAQHTGIVAHLRWVDDFFIAVDDTAGTAGALRVLADALAPMGLHLNLAKTRILDSLPQYDRESLADQHRTVTSLALTSRRAPLSRSQRKTFDRLAKSDRIQSTEHGRLWKRIYALATRLRSSALVSEAIDDLALFPTAESQIPAYLEAVDWPSGTSTQASKLLLRRTTTDTQAINVLRRFPASQPSLDHQARRTLHKLAVSDSDNIHPYTLSLVHACLAAAGPAEQYVAANENRLIPLATNSTSPMARRLANQLLWLIPGNHATLRPQILNDPSYSVRSLANPRAIASFITGPGHAAHTHRAFPEVSLSASASARIDEAFAYE